MERIAPVLDVRGRRHSLGSRAWIMGVVNVTPDSFSDGGAYLDPEKAIDHAAALACEGADVIDIGGESTRPGSKPVSADEELARVLPVIRAVRRRTGALVSVDTTKAAVARAAVAEGADIVNDISALRFDPAMAAVIAETGTGVILSHMQGTPATMQAAPHYGDVVAEVRAFLAERAAEAEAAGIPAGRIVIDPGIGFGKTTRHNLELLDRLDALAALGRPVCVGFSRKAFIGNVLGLPPDERLEGTIAAAVLSVARGAHILRVHDVAPVTRAVRMAEAILASRAPAGASDSPTEEAGSRHAR